MHKILVAKSRNNVIGKDGDIPWKLSDDFKNFKAVTTGQILIMGRKTYESIGRPLPNRDTIIVTRNLDYSPKMYPNLSIANSIEEAVQIAAQIATEGQDIIWSGGEAIYEAGLKYASELLVTEVDVNIVNGDAFFPPIGPEWNQVESKSFQANEKNNYHFTIDLYLRA